MKRIIVSILLLGLFTVSYSVRANNVTSANYSGATEVVAFYPNGTQTVIFARAVAYLPNGSKTVEALPISGKTRSTTSSQKGFYCLDNDNVILWKVTLTGSFTYNGSTSSCTSASSYSTVYQGNWSESDNNTFASGNAAVASVTMVRKILFITVETQVANLTITCDKDGNIQ